MVWHAWCGMCADNARNLPPLQALAQPPFRCVTFATYIIPGLLQLWRVAPGLLVEAAGSSLLDTVTRTTGESCQAACGGVGVWDGGWKEGYLAQAPTCRQSILARWYTSCMDCRCCTICALCAPVLGSCLCPAGMLRHIMTNIPDSVRAPAWDAVWEAALGSQLWLVPGSSPLADTCIQLANSRQLEWLLIDDAMRLMRMEPEPGLCGSLSACVVASYGAALNLDWLRGRLG